MISTSISGDFTDLRNSLQKIQKIDILSIMDSCGAEGVAALSAATPIESGLAAHSWDYDTHAKNGVYSISWTNVDIEHDFPVVIMLQYGYATGTGGYVQGRDFINPAMKPIFDKIAERVWKAVTTV